MRNLKPAILVLLLLVVSALEAQNIINSPYSRYGLGEMHGRNISTTLQGMGGISIGYSDPTVINPGNPASYAAFDSASFLFDVGVFGSFKTLKTTELSETGYYASLNYMLFGFPVTRWWRTSLGVMPYSKIGYDVNILIDVENFSNVENSIEGDGGINQFFWGNAFKIGENLRLGVDITYLYGESRKRSVVHFLDSLLILGTKTESTVRGSGFVFDYGLQYDIHFDKYKFLTLGLVYANSFDISATRGYLATTIMGGLDGTVPAIKDTVIYDPESTGDITLPQRIGFGLTYNQLGSWLIGADFEWENWEQFGGFGVTDTLNNAWRFSVGGEYTPRHTSLSSLFTRMSYRLGFRYNKSYLDINNNQIDEFGISFGVNIPMRRTRTSIDLSLEAGKRGTTKNNLIQENFFNFTIGISINEYWFHKRKYL